MDDRRFDRISRALGAAASRRQGAAAVIGLALGLASAGRGLGAGAGNGADAAPSPRGRRAAGPRFGPARPGPEGPCGDGSGADNTCRKDRDCCTRICVRSEGRRGGSAKGRCRCVKKGEACESPRNCCNGMACTNGRCAPRVPAPPTGCSFATCATGCCNAGVCLAGTADTACGVSSMACQVCPQGVSLCCGKYCTLGAWSNQTTITGASIQAPSGVAVSTDGLTALFTDASGGIVSVWTRSSSAASDWSGQTTFGASALNAPAGPALTRDGLTALIADTANHRIAVWTRTSASGTDWSEQTTFGAQGSASDQFQVPAAVALTVDGLTALVADSGNNRVAVWTRSDATATDWSDQTTFGSLGSGVGQLAGPMAVSLPADGLTAAVLDSGNNRVSVWTRTGANATDWSCQAQFGAFSTPFGVAITEDSRSVMVADSGANQLSLWTRASATSPTWGNVSTLGSAGSGSSQFSVPFALAFASAGRTALITDSANARISVWTMNCP